MATGLFAGVTWAVETVVIAIAMGLMPFVGSNKVFLAPFIETFLNDFFSAVYAFIYNAIKGNLKELFSTFKKPDFKWICLASAIGGPIGMTGYLMAVNFLGASIGAVACAVYPAIGRKPYNVNGKIFPEMVTDTGDVSLQLMGVFYTSLPERLYVIKV